MFKKFDDKFTLKFLHLLSDLLNSKVTVDKFASNGAPSFSKNYDIPVPNKQTSNDHFDSDDDKKLKSAFKQTMIITKRIMEKI